MKYAVVPWETASDSHNHGICNHASPAQLHDFVHDFDLTQNMAAS